MKRRMVFITVRLFYFFVILFNKATISVGM